MEIVSFEELPKHIKEIIIKKTRSKVINNHIEMGFVRKGELPVPKSEKIIEDQTQDEIEKLFIFKTGNPPFYYYYDGIEKIGY